MPNAVATANCAARASDFLLSGILRCGSCGTAYIGMSANGNGGNYRADHGHALRNVRKSKWRELGVVQTMWSQSRLISGPPLEVGCRFSA
jgi:hypothetical protein